jgi:HEPN domain-containing protein
MSDDRPPEENPPPAARWLRLADEDLSAGGVLLASEDVTRRIACFLAQQAAEKALKAGLLATGQIFPKIHGLTELLAQFPDYQRPDLEADELDELDPWIIDGRYAADLPDVDQETASHLLAIARRVVEVIRPLVIGRQ